ncbi:hypothetical protein PBI_CLEO_30 [Gordonia phage Cleo]|nr:hypothetical protein PBI_CLEO_30 [Gordonia phage Cleo]
MSDWMTRMNKATTTPDIIAAAKQALTSGVKRHHLSPVIDARCGLSEGGTPDIQKRVDVTLALGI